ncbi:MAG TPA: MFS transporter [Pyrinomonadaceae bacterium]|jgi:FSR family fosmidomycin resistance protein-like MFS transporter|nr:MFS transporter [Pyrinomonadaceae bacterium]
MFLRHNSANSNLHAASAARMLPFYVVVVLLGVEFLDELEFGVREAAWPLVRDDLHLSYVEVGLLLSVPRMLANFVEPFIGILGDVWRRRALVLGGGVCCATASLLVSVSYNFWFLLGALILFFPASGAFVNLSQATLMDAEPQRREQNMARWTLFGTLGNLVGPMALSAFVWLGLGWRWLFACLAALFFVMLLPVSRFKFPAPPSETGETKFGFREGLRQAFRALKRREVRRWLILLEFSDFTWDMLRGFLALYFVDVVHVPASQAAFAVIVWTAAGLPAEFFLVPILERVRGLSYLRWSTLCVLLLFPAFLLAPDFNSKLVCLALLGYANTGWYSILKAQLYSAMHGQSGTVMTVSNVSDLFSGLLPFALGAVAQRFGLTSMMWLLLVGPLALAFGVRRTRDEE